VTILFAPGATAFQRLAANAVPKRLPLQQLYGDEVLAIGFVNFINCAGVGMIESRRGESFALKWFACGGIVFQFGWKKF
jgi:hypothetical protein